MAIGDILGSVSSLLSDNWDSGNTGGRLPSFNKIFDLKRADFSMAGTTDHVFLYESSFVDEDSATGGTTKKVVSTIMADMRTVVSHAHAILMRDEIRRILRANEKSPVSNIDILDGTEYTDLSDRTVKIWRFTVKIVLQAFNDQ